MSDLKTKPHNASVSAFLKAVEHETRRRDALTINEMMTRITGEKPKMWGPTIVGFGSYHYKYDSGREGDWLMTGFSPRKSAMSLYIMPGYGQFDDVMARLGKHKTGKACLYINKLEDVDMAVLEELITKSVAWMREKYGT
jgi:hypothetical protein